MSLADRIKAADEQQKAERAAAATEERTALHYALSQVYDGATAVETSCVLDYLGDMGWRLVADEHVAQVPDDPEQAA